jgi:hypothetical protein
MAWNPSPKVADCREIARKCGNGIEQVIIIGIDGDGRTTTATYGRTAQLCACADAFGKAAIKGIHRHIEDAECALAEYHLNAAVDALTRDTANAAGERTLPAGEKP